MLTVEFWQCWDNKTIKKFYLCSLMKYAHDTHLCKILSTRRKICAFTFWPFFVALRTGYFNLSCFRSNKSNKLSIAYNIYFE